MPKKIELYKLVISLKEIDHGQIEFGIRNTEGKFFCLNVRTGNIYTQKETLRGSGYAPAVHKDQHIELIVDLSKGVLAYRYDDVKHGKAFIRHEIGESDFYPYICLYKRWDSYSEKSYEKAKENGSLKSSIVEIVHGEYMMRE